MEYVLNIPRVVTDRQIKAAQLQESNLKLCLEDISQFSLLQALCVSICVQVTFSAGTERATPRILY